MKYKYYSASEIGLKRSFNEDSIGIFDIPSGLLIVVCDGLGGNNAGEVASRLSVETIHSSFVNSDKADYLDTIKDSIIAANKLIKEKSNKHVDYFGMATTVEVFFISKDTAYWGHVGDSRIYILRNNKLKQLTKDHSLIQKLIDEGHLTLKQAENHPNRNIIIRALGDKSTVDVDLSKQKIYSGDAVKFFICTDGITEVLNDEEIEKILSIENDNEICSRIKCTVEERGAPDNYSYVIIEKSSK